MPVFTTAAVVTLVGATIVAVAQYYSSGKLMKNFPIRG